MLVRGGKTGYQALRKYGIEGKDISRLYASLGTDKSLVGKEKTEYFRTLNKVLRNPDDFPDEIMEIQKQLGIDVGLGFKKWWSCRHPGGVMAIIPENKKFYTYGVSKSLEGTGAKVNTWYFDPPDETFLKAYNSGLTNNN